MADPADLNKGWWEARYRDRQTAWDRADVSPALLHWLTTGDLAPGRVLVPGCGRGHEVIELARRGFGVTALDIAPSPIAFLQKRLRKERLPAEVVQTDVLVWEARQPFDAIYEQTSLCALVPSQWETYADRLCRWLRPGGKLFALFMQTHSVGGPPFHCDLAHMRELFPSTNWFWLDTPTFEVPHPVGFCELGYVLKRRDSAEP
ncbi:MAG: methyltransferase domain-containing protein [Acidiferrobacterales bacterium]